MPAPETVRLTPRGSARVRGGHPWVFRADVVADGGGAGGGRAAGDDVAVADERGRVLGAALWAAEPAPTAPRGSARAASAPSAAAPPAPLAAAAARRAGAEVCRLVHAEADQLPGLFIDRYGDAAALQSATAGIDRREADIA